jgi:hypothetical protein
LLLLPYRAPCALTDPIDARTGATLGAIDPTRALLVGGKGSAGAVPTTALVDLARGTVAPLGGGLLVPRTRATITPWAGGAVVAGGERPDTGELVASAEVFASASGDFDGAPIALSEARTHHGAAALVSGETLLVGGRGASGVLGSLEIVDPVAKRARTAGLVSLSVPREDPTVLRLASGEVLVAGGVDASGAPVATLEWLASDARSASKRPRDLVASTRRAFVALDPGGALAVIAPDAATPAFQNAWVVSADGALAPATAIDGTLGDVRLFAGTGGEPVAWTGDRWLQWDPWAGAFGPLDGASGAVGPSGDPSAAAEPGLAVWADGDRVRALRFGTRGAYATTPASSPLLTNDTAFTAPDRFVSGLATDPVRFDPTGGLSLDTGAAVFVTDATYASFTLDAQTPTASPPALVLRDASGVETVIDPRACGVAPGATLHVERARDRVRAASDVTPLTDCPTAPAADARVSLGVRGITAGPSVIRSVIVARSR